MKPIFLTEGTSSLSISSNLVPIENSNSAKPVAFLVINLKTAKAHMPVLRDGKIAGIIRIGDVVKHRLEDLESETNVLRDAYMASR